MCCNKIVLKRCSQYNVVRVVHNTTYDMSFLLLIIETREYG